MWLMLRTHMGETSIGIHSEKSLRLGSREQSESLIQKVGLSRIGFMIARLDGSAFSCLSVYHTACGKDELPPM